LFSTEYIPNCIIGDFDSIRKDVEEKYKTKFTKMLKKSDTETSDLEKSLYFAMERLSEESYSNYIMENYEMVEDNNKKKTSIIILGSCGGRIDHTISAYNSVYRYLKYYQVELSSTDIFLFSKSSISFFLQNGDNLIFPSSTWEKKEDGYSIICLEGEACIKVYESDSILGLFILIEGKFLNKYLEKYITFGNTFFFRKRSQAKKIKINVSMKDKESALIYSTTSLFHNK
jgi:thiamine pyrophosphokinase